MATNELSGIRVDSCKFVAVLFVARVRKGCHFEIASGIIGSAMRRTTTPALYENAYSWLVFLAALDIMLTWVVLWYGGNEENVLAASVLDHFGLGGMVLFKFILVIVVILLCEVIGRRSRSAGRMLVRFGIALTTFPVVLAFGLLLLDLWIRGRR